MKICIFGTGIIYKRIRNLISSDIDIVAFLDNNSNLWGKDIDGICVKKPREVNELECEYIVLASLYAPEMQQQLVELGVSQEKILHFFDFLSKFSDGSANVYLSQYDQKFLGIDKKELSIDEIAYIFAQAEKSILFITYNLNYDGGGIAAINAVEALKKKGFTVMVATPFIDKSFCSEMVNKGCSFLISPKWYVPNERLIKISEFFDHVIVNTFPMSLCAGKIAEKRKVVEWLHESEIEYQRMRMFEPRLIRDFINNNLSIYAVSRIARDNFLRHFPETKVGILEYGIPDEKRKASLGEKDGITFALIAGFHEIKGQDIFIETIEQINQKYRNEKISFILIGDSKESVFSNKILDAVNRIPNLNYLGKLDRAEIQKAYQEDIDVVVVPSRQETMSLTATEAMMYGKMSIVSDAAGIADYIDNGVNGLVFESENSDELAERISWCIENRSAVNMLGKEARRRYEKYFSMESLSNRLEAVL